MVRLAGWHWIMHPTMILSWLPLNVNFAHVWSHLTALKIASSKIIVNLARIFNKLIDPRCFPHIVNLACKAVIAALARSDYGSITGDHTDPISTLCALVWAVCIICQLFKLDLSTIGPGFITPPPALFRSLQKIWPWSSAFTWCWYSLVLNSIHDWTGITFRKSMWFSSLSITWAFLLHFGSLWTTFADPESFRTWRSINSHPKSGMDLQLHERFSSWAT